MSPTKPRHVILVGNQQVALPEGVTALDWGLERVNYQNPRIRSYLGCIRLIEGVLESNYALLHCSPERLLDIWKKVRQVAAQIRTQLSPLLEAPSRIPRLEEARESGRFNPRRAVPQRMQAAEGFVPIVNRLAQAVAETRSMARTIRFAHVPPEEWDDAFREPWLDPRVAPFRDRFSTYTLLFYLSVRIPQLGYRATEVPVVRAYPPKTKTPTKIAGMRGRFDMLGELWDVVRGRYNPDAASR